MKASELERETAEHETRNTGTGETLGQAKHCEHWDRYLFHRKNELK